MTKQEYQWEKIIHIGTSFRFCEAKTPAYFYEKVMVNSRESSTGIQGESDMAISKAEEMVKRLREMQAATPEIEASAVVSVDGLTIASALPTDVEEDRVSAMSAAMLSLGDRIASELNRGMLDQVYIHGDDGYVILSAIGDEAVLTALAKEKAKLGLVFLEMRRAAEDLSQFFD